MKKRPPAIDSQIKTHRLRMGWTQESLAKKIGVGRQAVYDMESGRYLPNTAVALHLADLFGRPVETLFPRRETTAAEPVRIASDQPLAPGSRLALVRIRGEIVGVPLHGFSLPGLIPADAIVQEGGGIAMTIPQRLIDQNLLIFGCNPALDALDPHIRRTLPSARVRSLFASSTSALAALKENTAQVASTHFHSDSDDAGIASVKSILPETPCAVIAFASNEEGLMLAHGNPLGLRGLGDLTRPDVRLANREPGAALRRLLDAGLAARGIPYTMVNGYNDIVRSHNEGAARVTCGTADAALGMRIVAEAFGLAFLPLAVTRCDLVIPEDLITTPAIDAMLNALCSARFYRELQGLPGYDPTLAGREIMRAATGAKERGALHLGSAVN